ncbi:MAG TPA: cupin domain-containing protein [Burkholderiales bacterium]|nr:cupin domain-containing protein [Burkholderiales bacterium]
MSKRSVTLTKDEGEKLEVLGAQVRFLCQGADTGRAWSLMEVVLPRDGGPPAHDHPWDEAYYVIEGEVRFTLGDKVQQFKGGDFIYAPGGTLHAFQGVSTQPARMLVFDAPAAAEGFFRDVHREVSQMPRDLPKVAEIGARHKLRFMPPG